MPRWETNGVFFCLNPAVQNTEKVKTNRMQSCNTLYAKDINLNVNISKNTLTGNGNTAEAVLKYIHTYSKVKGSISITPGSETVAGSFSLSNTDRQWSFVCTVTNIPY